MATTTRVMPAAPDEVFAVLADAASYSHWVVGSQRIRSVEGEFPLPGSRFHHVVGVGLLQVRDHTEVLECDPPRLLVLHARARPLGTARIRLELLDDPGGTRVVMEEKAGDLLTALVLNPLTDPLVDQRNRVALRRLERLVVARQREHGSRRRADDQPKVSRRPRSGSSSRA